MGKIACFTFLTIKKRTHTVSKEDKKEEKLDSTLPKSQGSATTNEQEPIELQLKDPGLAAFLAWLIPGLGHFYQGRLAKAVLFFVCIMGTFTYGLYLGSGPDVGKARVVYWEWKPQDKRLYYFCQVGIGLPALPAIVQSIRVKNGNEPFGTFMAPPRIAGDRDPNPNRLTLSDLHRHLGRFFELGTIYTSIAGLLNLLAIFDAFAGPVAPESNKKGKEEKETEGQSKEPNPSDKNQEA